MKFSCIFIVTFWCTLYISEKSTALKLLPDENNTIQPTDESSNVMIQENSETNTSELLREELKSDESAIVIIEENSETNTSDLQIEDKKLKSNKLCNVTIKELSETDSSDMLRKGKKPKAVRNCQDLKLKGKQSGAYLITPCDDTPAKVVKVYCDMDTDGGGWTVIQRRDNFAEPEDFNNNWYKYAVGFGDILKDFWLGNDNIHCLTDQSENEIRFDLEDWEGNKAYAKYGFFYVDDRSNWYKMVSQNYTGTAGDSLTYHNNVNFTTYDSDNDQWSSDCASFRSGAWWYKACAYSNLNGRYNVTSYKGNVWYHWKGNSYPLKKTEMKLRAKQYK